MDARQMREQVEAWQGVALEDPAAARLAGVSAAVREALDAVAPQSLFDSEPAHFERALKAMARDD